MVVSEIVAATMIAVCGFKKSYRIILKGERAVRLRIRRPAPIVSGYESFPRFFIRHVFRAGLVIAMRWEGRAKNAAQRAAEARMRARKAGRVVKDRAEDVRTIAQDSAAAVRSSAQTVRKQASVVRERAGAARERAVAVKDRAVAARDAAKNRFAARRRDDGKDPPKAAGDTNLPVAGREANPPAVGDREEPVRNVPSPLLPPKESVDESKKMVRTRFR